ncbi:MAG: hypothetical protein ACU85V_04185 [Gammaproteobacteria bacterium]
MTSPLIMCAQPYGYGPVSKLLYLAEVLRRENVPMVFMGTDISLELAQRSRGLFKQVLSAPASSAIARRYIRDSIGVLSVMDREYSAAAGELQHPLYIVDSLYWMRPANPPAFRGARIHWAQDFAGVREQMSVGDDTVRLTGPILSPSLPEWQGGEGLVINLGGASSTFASARENAAYWRFVMDGISQSALAEKYAGRIRVIGGEHCLELIKKRFGGAGFTFASVRHGAAVGVFARADVVLTSPGLTAALECFKIGAPALFLPPQNYSQWCNLRIFRHRGLADLAFHWEDMDRRYYLQDRLQEAERDPIIRRAIDELSANDGARRRFSASVSGMASCDLQEVRRRQAAFFGALGPDGTTQIVRELLACLESDRTALVPGG